MKKNEGNSEDEAESRKERNWDEKKKKGEQKDRKTEIFGKRKEEEKLTLPNS